VERKGLHGVPLSNRLRYGERRELPQWGPGWIPGCQCIFGPIFHGAIAVPSVTRCRCRRRRRCGHRCAGGVHATVAAVATPGEMTI